VVAIAKPHGMVVHPAPGNWNGTLVNALLHHVQQQGGRLEDVGGDPDRPGIVHRLDKGAPNAVSPPKAEFGWGGADFRGVGRGGSGTSGVLIAAKTQQSRQRLSKAFASRAVNKTYLAVCIGNPGTNVVIEAPIGRHPFDRQKMAVAAATREGAGPLDPPPRGAAMPPVGRYARSVVNTLAFDGKLSVVEVAIETGRTHQIRVHLQHRRTPVLGDDLYGNGQWNSRMRTRQRVIRPMLHAHRLALPHPVTREPLVVTAPIPPDLHRMIRTIWPQVEQERPQWFSEGTADPGEEEAWWDPSLPEAQGKEVAAVISGALAQEIYGDEYAEFM
jgi:23S rRNA-/tRNA-specific pseudouridylate synthase